MKLASSARLREVLGRKGRAGAPEISLDDLNKRRGQLWSMSLFWASALTISLAVFSVGRNMLPEVLRFESMGNWILLVLLAGLMASLLLYVAEKESSLRRLADQLLEEKVRSAGLSHRLQEAAKMSEVARAINGSLDLPVVLDTILEQALDLLGGDEASIMLLSSDGTHLEVVSYRGTAHDTVLGARVELGQGISGVVAEQRTPLLLGSDPGPPVEGRGHPERSITSAMSCPLVRREQLVGVLNITQTSENRRFIQDDLKALGFFAEHAAIALGNARTFARERETVTRLEELDRLKQDFLANVSHELRSPLASIIGSAKTIRRNSDRMTTDDLFSFIDVIDRQGQRLLGLVEELLTSSGVESGGIKLQRTRIELASFIDDIVADMDAAHGSGQRKILTELRSQDPVIWCDERALNHIVRNLVDNAIKYSEEKTTITITAEQRPSEVVITVTDEGRGIPGHLHDQIFDRFRQVDPSSTRSVGGVGLGLAIVKSLVELHNGTITLESQEGKGSTFVVTIPQRSPDR